MCQLFLNGSHQCQAAIAILENTFAKRFLQQEDVNLYRRVLPVKNHKTNKRLCHKHKCSKQ